MTASEGKIYISLGFQRALKGTEDLKVYLNKSQLRTSLIGEGNRHSDPGNREVPPKKSIKTVQHFDI